jgi:hypothetical protein
MKAAKATVKTVEDAYKKASRLLDKKGRKSVRKYERNALMNAQGRLEDWLYYQNSSNRWMRLRAIYPDSRLEVEAERLQRRTPYLLDNYAENVTVHGVRTFQVPRGSEMAPPHLDQHLLHLSRS